MLHSSEAREGPTGPCARWTTREILLVFPMRDAHRVVSPDQKLRRIQAKRLDPIHRISAIFADNCNHPANPSYQIKIRSFILLGMAQHYWPSIWCWYTDQTEQNAVVQKMGFQILNPIISYRSPGCTCLDCIKGKSSRLSRGLAASLRGFPHLPHLTDGGKTDMKTVMVVVVQLSCIPGRWCTDTSICLHVFSLVRVKQDAWIRASAAKVFRMSKGMECLCIV